MITKNKIDFDPAWYLYHIYNTLQDINCRPWQIHYANVGNLAICRWTLTGYRTVTARLLHGYRTVTAQLLHGFCTVTARFKMITYRMVKTLLISHYTG